MGKIVKYCTVCEEGFAEKFSFCPNCAATLTAYEMNPLGALGAEPAKVTEPLKTVEPVNNTVQNFEAETPSAITAATPEIIANTPEFVAQEPEPATPAFLMDDDSEILDLHSHTEPEEIAEEPETVTFEPVVPAVIPAATVEPAAVPAATVGSFNQPYTTNEYQESGNQSQGNYNYAANTAALNNDSFKEFTAPTKISGGDDGYHITMVEEKNKSTRQMLLLGAFVMVMCLTFGGIIISLFRNNLYIGAIDDDSVIAYLPADNPDEIKEEKPEVKKEDKGGGGGGGGKKDPTPTSQGDIARQMKNPTVPPSHDEDRVTNPDIKQIVATEGKETNEKSSDRYGNPNSKYTIGSDGTGSGGGQGEGNGRGQGNGNGTGRGNGNGSGSGDGIGNGNGNGTGDGSGDGPPPSKKPAVTEALKILAKPKGLYTDAARQNQVQGTVRLRVTFLASGAIGSISVVSGLGNGLTEQAIAAARGIRFEPQKVNGVAVATTKQIDYSFTLY